MWYEWCNNRNIGFFWWIWDFFFISNNKAGKMTQVTSERETKWEERERVIARWVLSSNCNNGESLTQLHCFLYHCQLSPPLSPFHWMKFPTSCLFKLSPILSFQRSLPVSHCFFFTVHNTFCQVPFFSGKHRSYQNTVPVWNWTLFFLWWIAL